MGLFRAKMEDKGGLCYANDICVQVHRDAYKAVHLPDRWMSPCRVNCYWGIDFGLHLPLPFVAVGGAASWILGRPDKPGWLLSPQNPPNWATICLCPINWWVISLLH
jgi:hypothetical protein